MSGSTYGETSLVVIPDPAMFGNQIPVARIEKFDMDGIGFDPTAATLPEAANLAADVARRCDELADKLNKLLAVR